MTQTSIIAAPLPRAPWLSSDAAWGLFFLLPYVVVFVLFVAYPIGYAIWLATDLKAYVRLFDDPIYWRTAWNTLVFLLVGVNLKMILALFLSGFFALPYLWVRILGAIFVATPGADLERGLGPALAVGAREHEPGRAVGATEPRGVRGGATRLACGDPGRARRNPP